MKNLKYNLNLILFFMTPVKIKMGTQKIKLPSFMTVKNRIQISVKDSQAQSGKLQTIPVTTKKMMR